MLKIQWRQKQDKKLMSIQMFNVEAYIQNKNHFSGKKYIDCYNRYTYLKSKKIKDKTQLKKQSQVLIDLLNVFGVKWDQISEELNYIYSAEQIKGYYYANLKDKFEENIIKKLFKIFKKNKKFKQPHQKFKIFIKIEYSKYFQGEEILSLEDFHDKKNRLKYFNYWQQKDYKQLENLIEQQKKGFEQISQKYFPCSTKHLQNQYLKILTKRKMKRLGKQSLTNIINLCEKHDFKWEKAACEMYGSEYEFGKAVELKEIYQVYEDDKKKWKEHEDIFLIDIIKRIGRKWVLIAQFMEDRNAQEIKDRYQKCYKQILHNKPHKNIGTEISRKKITSSHPSFEQNLLFTSADPSIQEQLTVRQSQMIDEKQQIEEKQNEYKQLQQKKDKQEMQQSLRQQFEKYQSSHLEKDDLDQSENQPNSLNEESQGKSQFQEENSDENQESEEKEEQNKQKIKKTQILNQEEINIIQRGGENQQQSIIPNSIQQIKQQHIKLVKQTMMTKFPQTTKVEASETQDQKIWIGKIWCLGEIFTMTIEVINIDRGMIKHHGGLKLVEE